MRLTTKGRFAVTAMLDLAINAKEGPVTLANIAERQKISLSYLEQLFSKLRRSELVDSVRGPGGGYRLANSTHLFDDLILSDVGKVDGINDGLAILGKGTFKFSITDDGGRVHHICIPNSLYLPKLDGRLLLPQHWAQEAGDNETWMDTRSQRTKAISLLDATTAWVVMVTGIDYVMDSVT